MSISQVKLVNTVLDGRDRDKALDEAKESLAHGQDTIMMDEEAWITVEMIATGALSPCDGSMNSEDYNSVLHTGRLADGTPWPTPLSFAMAGDRNQEVLKGLKKGEIVTLINRDKQAVARITTEEVSSTTGMTGRRACSAPPIRGIPACGVSMSAWGTDRLRAKSS